MNELSKEHPVTVYPDSQRKFGAWIGGSMLASLSTFPQMLVTRQVYEEENEAVLHRKFFH